MFGSLHQLVEAGDLEGIQKLLEQGFKPSDLNSEQFDLLYNTLLIPVRHSPQEKAKKENICILLLEHDPNLLHRTDKLGYSLAHTLARLGYEAVLKKLIQQGRGHELKIPDKRYQTLPIHMAIINEMTTIVELLLTIPGMSTVKDADNRNIIHYAARHSTTAMVDCCCEHPNVAYSIRSLVKEEDKSGKTPAQLLLDYNTTGDVSAIMDILVSHGAERISRTPSPFRTTYH